jgi:hypothetical protein
MTNIASSLTAALGILASACAWASPAGGGRGLSADRPDATESPITVEPGRVQIESGLYDWSRDGGNDIHTLLSIHAKFGLSDSVDFGLLIDGFIRMENTGAEAFGDIGLTLKWNLWGNNGGDTALAILPYLKVPTHTAVSSGEWEGGLAMPFAMGFADGWDLGLMAAMDLADDGTGGHQVEFLHTAVIARDLGASFGTFLEYIGVAADDRYEASLATGLTCLLNEDLMLDISLRVGLNRAAPDIGMATGLTVRF